MKDFSGFPAANEPQQNGIHTLTSGSAIHPHSTAAEVSAQIHSLPWAGSPIWKTSVLPHDANHSVRGMMLSTSLNKKQEKH